MTQPKITIAIPSFNQGRFIDEALSSIFEQDLPVEVFVLDGGSSDNTLDVINKWEHLLAGWRSHPDKGQAAAINEGVSQGTAPYVCWLNSDDLFLPGGLSKLLLCLDKSPSSPAVYGKALNLIQKSGNTKPVWVEPFDRDRLAIRCIVSQPASLIRRTAWCKVGGLDESLHMAMDYDLWWKLSAQLGDLKFLEEFVAVNRVHSKTKTNTLRNRHYSEAMGVVRKYYGRVPFKWWLFQPYAVWFKSIKN